MTQLDPIQLDLAGLSDARLDEAMTAALRTLDLDGFERLALEADRRQAEREARLSAPDVLGKVALWYARHGIAVFPLQPRDKRPLPGSRGFKDATCDPATVRGWWTSLPTANIGLPTGVRFDVLDVDGPAGYRSLVDVREAGRLPSFLARSRTPGNRRIGRPPGLHYYLAPTGDGNAANVLPGLDFRGAGGYVLAPPSVGADGDRYRWLDPLDSDRLPEGTR